MADDFDQDKPKRGEEISGAPDEEVSGAPDEGAVRKRKRQPRSSSSRWPLYMVAGCLLSCCLCCVLPWCVLAVTGASLAAIVSNSQTTDTQTRTFPIDSNSPLNLTVENTSGSIDVQRGTNNDQVTITYTRKSYGWTKSAAQKELENITVDLQQSTSDPNTITVKVASDRETKSFWFLANNVDMTITVPEDVSLTLNNTSGSITIQDVRARALNVQSNTGSITFDGQILPNPNNTFNIQTNTGSISVSLPANVSTKLDARADVGSVSVSDSFKNITDQNENHSGAGQTWSGTLNDSGEDLPTLRLHTNTGSISVGTQ